MLILHHFGFYPRVRKRQWFCVFNSPPTPLLQQELDDLCLLLLISPNFDPIVLRGVQKTPTAEDARCLMGRGFSSP